jgi:hypothetical protein
MVRVGESECARVRLGYQAALTSLAQVMRAEGRMALGAADPVPRLKEGGAEAAVEVAP